jgi:hypothetical protein
MEGSFQQIQEVVPAVNKHLLFARRSSYLQKEAAIACSQANRQAHLPLTVAVPPAKAAQPNLVNVHCMDGCKSSCHLLIHPVPLWWRHFRQARIQKDAALNMLHHIKVCADDGGVSAQADDSWHRDGCAIESLEYLHDGSSVGLKMIMLQRFVN